MNYTEEFIQVVIDKILKGVAIDFGMDYETLKLSAQQSLNEMAQQMMDRGNHLRVVK